MRHYFFSGILLFLLTPCQAQRIVARVVPPEEGLKFDTNDFPLTSLTLAQSTDLNFSPNVVFSPDSSQGFVSYPGKEVDDATQEGNKILCFDVATGAPVAVVEVDANPLSLTLSPDGTQLGVVSLFLKANTPSADNGNKPSMVGSVSVIDIRAFTVRKLELSDVGFSVFNNLVFSRDGSTGYVASAATDEIIRFDVASMTEIGPRLKMTPGTRPASLTMAADGSFFTVVLPGFSGLDIEEIPDSIQIVGTSTFSVVGSVVPDPLDVELSDGSTVKVHHDFFALNTVSITSDNKYAIIGDRENSRASSVPELASDHALIIDLEQRKVVQVLGVGAAAGATQVSPDGASFALITALNVVFYNPYSDSGVQSGTGSSQYRETSRPVFSADGKRLLVASPILDRIDVYDVATATATNRVTVARDRIPENVTVPAGPLDLTFSPDGTRLAVVEFNENNVEILENSYQLAVPQLVAENLDRAQTSDPNEEPELIPAADRFFSGLAVANFGDQDALVDLSAVGSLTNLTDPFDQLFLITANPNPVTVCAGEQYGQTTISWDTTDISESVEVRIGAVDGELFATGGATGSQETGEWVTDGLKFFLLDQSTREVLDTVTVFQTESGCPPPIITASANPIQVCDDSGRGQTTISWDATDVADEVEVRVGTADGPLLTEGGATGSEQTGRWVTDGTTFLLLNASDGSTLDTVTVELTEDSCPLTISARLKKNQQTTFSAADFLATNSSIEEPYGNFRGWVALDSDQSTLAGIFLTYDGALNRLDGGPISSAPLRTAIFPEIRITNGFATQVEAVNPNFSTANATFDLIDKEGRLLATSSRTLSAQSRSVFPVLSDLNDPSTLGLFDDADGLTLVVADPNPIQVCTAGARGVTTIRWNASGIAEAVEVRVNSVDGALFATGGATGSAETGEWVANGTTFYLIDQDSGEELDHVTVRFTEVGCPPPVIAATPNPTRVCNADELGQTTISWDATDYSEAVEVRTGSPAGTVVASGASTGSFSTGVTVAAGMVFYLVDADSGAVLDSVAVGHTLEGCPLLGFESGYIRATSEGMVGIETVSDAKSLAVLGAQSASRDDTRFTVPQVVAFGGTETVLNLIHPSTLPTGGVIDEDVEYEPETPIQVSMSLYDDTGNRIGNPLTTELVDGALLRGNVVDLFGLTDTGGVQSGWIAISSDRPGLVGSAEIRTFDGETLTAVPLQAVRDSRVVFPHVAQTNSFTTGLAIVNSSMEAIEFSVELRAADGHLIGTLGPRVLEPRNRLVGTIPELFPNPGDLLGGTVKIQADGPLTSLELFFTNDLLTLSAVPSQSIE